jgi:hypothetical protein
MASVIKTYETLTDKNTTAHRAAMGSNPAARFFFVPAFLN